MNELEIAYAKIIKQIEDKVADAVKLLKEANQLSIDSNLGTPKYNIDIYCSDELKDIVAKFVDLDDVENGWNSSGCSF